MGSWLEERSFVSFCRADERWVWLYFISACIRRIYISILCICTFLQFVFYLCRAEPLCVLDLCCFRSSCSYLLCGFMLIWYYFGVIYWSSFDLVSYLMLMFYSAVIYLFGGLFAICYFMLLSAHSLVPRWPWLLILQFPIFMTTRVFGIFIVQKCTGLFMERIGEDYFFFCTPRYVFWFLIGELLLYPVWWLPFAFAILSTWVFFCDLSFCASVWESQRGGRSSCPPFEISRSV